MINVASYNSNTDLWSYNCGSFAMQIYDKDWYVPNTLNGIKFKETPHPIEELLEGCARDILREFKGWRRITHYTDVSKFATVVGFRIGHVDGKYFDFHFVTRINRRWFHKPGGYQIEGLRKFNPDANWKRKDGKEYNSRIIWFVKEKR